MVKGVKTASGEVINLKTSYELGEKTEAFYTGGGVHFSNDGHHILTTCGSAIKVLSMDTGLVEKAIEEEEDLVTSFAVSSEGTVVIGWRSLLLRQYTLDECKCTRSWKGHLGPVIAMEFDTTSTLLATGSSDSTVKVWDCTKNYCTHNLRGSKGMVGVVNFHPDPDRLLLFSSASIDCSIRVWDLSSSSCIQVLSGHVSAVTALAIPVDGNIFLSAGRDKVVHVWDLEGGAAKKTIPVFESVEGLILLPDNLSDVDGPVKRALQAHRKKGFGKHGLLFATAGDKGVIRVWSSESCGPPCLCSCGQRARVSAADSQSEQTPKGREEERGREPACVYTSLHLCQELGALCGVTHDHNLVLYDLPQLSIRKQLIGYLDEVLDIALVGEGESHIAVATNSEEVKVFCRDTGSCQLLSGHTGIVLSLSSTHNGCVLATGSKDNTVRLWRMDTSTRLFECVAVGTGHTHAVGAVAISRLKSSFVVSGSQDCTIKMWRIGRSLVEEGEGSGQERETKKLKVKYTQLAHDKDINSLDVSPNDKLVVSGSQDKTAKLWQASDGALLGKFKGHRRGVWSVKFSSIDQCVATGSGDGTVKLWAVADFTCVKTFEGHSNSVLKVTFLTRGMQLASCGSDGLVKVWTIKTNECVATLDQHTEKVWCLACSGDGREIVSGGADSMLCYWKDVSERVEEEEQLKKEEQILREQELSNLLHHKDYVRAVGMAISLEQPFRVLKILQELLDEGGLKGKFKDTILSLREDQIHSVLQYASRWNTNARHCPVAQSVLSVILRWQTPEKIMELEDTKTLLEGLIPYTERHYQRMARLQQLSSFVDYTWQCMKLPSLDQLSEEGRLGESNHQSQLHQEPSVLLSAVMAAADSTTRADEVNMATEGQLNPEGEEELASDASSNDNHAITSTSRIKTKASRKEKLKARLQRAKKFKGRKAKLYLLSGSKKDRTKLKKIL